MKRCLLLIILLNTLLVAVQDGTINNSEKILIICGERLNKAIVIEIKKPPEGNQMI